MPFRVEILRTITDHYRVVMFDESAEFIDDRGACYASTSCFANAQAIVEGLVAKDPTLIVRGRESAAPEKPKYGSHEYMAGMLHGMIATVNAGDSRVRFSQEFINDCAKDVRHRNMESIVMAIKVICGDLNVSTPQITFPE